MDKNIKERYQLLNYLIEGCQIIDKEYRYIYLNDAVIKHSRFTREHLMGKTMSECYPGIEATEMFRKLKICMTYGLPAKMVNEFQYPDGSLGWFELVMQQVPDGVLIMSNDITRMIRDEQELSVKNQRLKALRTIDIEILRSTSLIEVLTRICMIALDHVDEVDAVDILLFNKLNDDMDYFAGYGFNGDHFKEISLHLNEELVTMLKHVEEELLPLDISNVESKRIDERLKVEKFMACNVIPLRSKDQLIGLVELFQRSKREINREELHFMKDLSKQAAIAIENNNLYESLIVKNQALSDAYESIIEGWSRALEIRDYETKGHTLRVTDIAMDFARFLGYKDFDFKLFKYGCLMHDLGKIIVPESVLLKPGPLNDEEWEIMKQHPVHAMELLKSISYLEGAVEVPYNHHEWYDGSGYPRGISGNYIPLFARIFAFADVYDALTSDRPYRKAWTHEQTIAYIEDLKGKQFDPDLTEAFMLFINAYMDDLQKDS